MFVVTFYSFKGGVGRTMALVNIAAQLSSRGKKVLLVDFDLEAPGLSAYPQFSSAASSKGIVEYVSDYTSSAVSPLVDEYIVECAIDKEQSSKIWIMPSGVRDSSYSSRLGEIDWHGLYEFHSGYLFFEDLREQWRSHRSRFDYVLIDSRTGHTDVGGICTRQLADLDVFMFVPNRQNILGMKTVVENVRNDTTSADRPSELIFCPSNVPDLDDEYGILKEKFDLAQSELGYDEPASVIHHYNSISLIDDSVFVLDRPRSRLAREYERLHDRIASTNIEDRVGALLYIGLLRDQILEARFNHGGAAAAGLNETLFELSRVSNAHLNDGEVAMELADAYQFMGRLPEEEHALSIAITENYRAVEARLRRARNLASQSRADEARIDLRSIFAVPDLTGIQFSSAFDALRNLDPDWLQTIRSAPALRKMSNVDAAVVAEALLRDTQSSELAYEIASRALATEVRQAPGSPYDTGLFLALIGNGRFEDAVNFYRSTVKEMAQSTKIIDVFNYAMAIWGYTRRPPLSLLSRVLDLGRATERDANFVQCLALCHAALGDVEEALQLVERARALVGPGSVFSCWSYQTRDRKSMLADLDAMKQAFVEGSIIPEFISRHG